MLRKFSVSNYRCFKDTITMDFTKKRDYAFNPQCVKDNLLTKAMIFGKNGSGKSNLGLALFDIVMTLTDKNASILKTQDTTFLNADRDKVSAISSAIFTYEFLFGDDILTYSYQKSASENLTKESLFLNGEEVFNYEFASGDFTANLSLVGIETPNFEYKEKNLSLVRYLANNAKIDIKSPLRKMMDFANKMLWFRSVTGHTYIGYETGASSTLDYIVNNNLAEDFSAFLKKHADLELKFYVIKDINGKNIFVERHEQYGISFAEAMSSGTSALLLMYFWSKRFDDVSFLFIDEFDAFYHHELASSIVRSVMPFENTQVIFTSHNTYLASNNLMRPDCYFVIKKDEIKPFSELTHRELREGHSLEKMYRSGEFDE